MDQFVIYVLYLALSKDISAHPMTNSVSMLKEMLIFLIVSLTEKL